MGTTFGGNINYATTWGTGQGYLTTISGQTVAGSDNNGIYNSPQVSQNEGIDGDSLIYSGLGASAGTTTVYGYIALIYNFQRENPSSGEISTASISVNCGRVNSDVTVNGAVIPTPNLSADSYSVPADGVTTDALHVTNGAGSSNAELWYQAPGGGAFVDAGPMCTTSPSGACDHTYGPWLPNSAGNWNFKVNVAGKDSNIIAITFYIPPPSLNAPTTLCAGSTPGVSLSWSRVTGVQGYRIYRNGALFTTIGPDTTTSTNDFSVSSGSGYTYTVTGYYGANESARSNQVSATATWCTGNITVNATKDGAAWSGSVSYTLTGPATIFGSSVSQSYSAQSGIWSLTYNSGGPAGTSLSSITPSNPQTLPSNVSSQPSITFVMNFTTIPLPPPAPSLSSATPSCSGSTSQITLAWSAVSGATGYKVYRAVAPGSPAFLLDVGNVTSYVDTGVTAGTTYNYQVTAYNGANESARSNQLSAVASSCAVYPTPTLAANKYTVLANNSDTVVLSVSNGAANSGAELWYRKSAGSGAPTAWTNSGVMCTTNGSGTCSATFGPWANTAATVGAWDYYVYVPPQGSSGKQSNIITITFLPPAPVLAAPVTSCSASSPRIVLSWGTVTGAAGYKVYRNGVLLQDVGNVTSYTDPAATAGTTYSYTITDYTYTGAFDSAASNPQSATAPWCTGNITVAATLNGSPWSGSVAYQLLGPSTVSGAAVQTTHPGLQNGSWTLSYTSGGPTGAAPTTITPSPTQTLPGNQAAQPSLSFTMTFSSSPPSPPTTGTPPTGSPSWVNSTCQQITVNWNDNSSNELGFHVWRNPTGGSSLGAYTQIASLPANTVSFTDTPPAPGTAYYYIVTAYNAGGESVVDPSWPLGPITDLPCAPNLSGSQKYLAQVNGAPYTNQPLNNNDLLTFQIVIANTPPLAAGPANQVTVADTLSGNLQYQAASATLDKGLGPVPLTERVTGQSITWPRTGDLGSKPADTSNWVLTFQARVVSTATQAVDYIQNTAVISYKAGSQQLSRSVQTPLLPVRTGQARIPQIKEVAP